MSTTIKGKMMHKDMKFNPLNVTLLSVSSFPMSMDCRRKNPRFVITDLVAGTGSMTSLNHLVVCSPMPSLSRNRDTLVDCESLSWMWPERSLTKGVSKERKSLSVTVKWRMSENS